MQQGSKSAGFKPIVSLSNKDDVVIDFNQKLGEWTFGLLYKGYSKSLNKQVMVKCVDLKKFPLSKTCLDLEITILQKLKDSEYIVKFAEYRFYDKSLTIVTDICNHGNLREYLKKEGPIPEEKALRLLLQITHGLRSLHDAKYCHGSLRPENILLHEENGQIIPKLSNFIFSRPINAEAFKRSEIPYDSLYLSPEVLKGEKTNAKSDLWALGVIYYEMLYGAIPWKGKDMKVLEAQILSDKLEFPGNINVSETSVNFIQQLLQRKQEKRMDWGDLMNHRLIFRGLFSNGDGTFKAFNTEFGNQTPSSKKLVYGMRMDSNKQCISYNPSKVLDTSMSIKNTEGKAQRDHIPTFSRQNTTSIAGDDLLNRTLSNHPDEEVRRSTTHKKTASFGYQPSLGVLKKPTHSRQPSNGNNTSMHNNANMNKTINESFKRENPKYYENLVSMVGSTDDVYRMSVISQRKKSSVSSINQTFSKPFQALSQKATMLGEIYQRACDNKDHPLYEKIMQLLQNEVQNMNNNVTDAKKLGERFSVEVNDISKITTTTKKDESIIHKGPKPKLAQAKKTKSQEIYELLDQILASITTTVHPNVNNEDLLMIATNFKVLREFDEIGETVVQELEQLKDILGLFYRQRQFSHLKYLLLIKNMV